MSLTFEELLKIEYGTPLASLAVETSRSFRDMYHKVGDHKYIRAYAAEGREIIFNGFAWIASDGVAEWIFNSDTLADDESNLPPPGCLLPEPGMFSYQALVDHGRRADPENFSDQVLGPCRVSFGVFTYYYRKAMPSKSDYPIAIEVDLSPWKNVRFGSQINTV